MMLSLMLSLALAADSGDTGDSAPFQDTDAKAELVYEQDPGGCGKESAALLLLLGGFGAIGSNRRSQQK